MTVDNPQRFWMVQGDGPARYRHYTRASAETEAHRLARENPGRIFFVLETVSAVRRRDVDYISFRPDDEEIPF